ncbi:hypothetical protein [Actinopolymorpha alba]|uniref:hypothetical protein n=1 Tax=Actinopolymorpha alba TaxID=533267 RepID=UPI0012F633F5|nr:hypothetical protein [Actinopolymorpha alba]
MALRRLSTRKAGDGMIIDYTQRERRLARIRIRAEVARRRSERMRDDQEGAGQRTTARQRAGRSDTT